MLWAGFILGAGLFINAITGLLSLVNYVIPTQISTGIGTLIGKIGVFQAVFPVDQLLYAFVFVLVAWLAVASARILFGVMGVIPGVSPRLPDQKGNFNHRK